MYVVMYGFLNPLFLLNIMMCSSNACLRKKNIVLDIQMRLESSPYIMTTKKTLLRETTTKKKLPPSAISNYCQITE